MHNGNAPGNHHRKRAQGACEAKEEQEEAAEVQEHGNSRRAFSDSGLFVCGHGACRLCNIGVCSRRENHRHAVLVHRGEHHKLVKGERNQQQQGKPCPALPEICD